MLYLMLFSFACVFVCLVVAKGTATSLLVFILMKPADLSLSLSQICAYLRISVLEPCFHISARPDKTTKKNEFLLVFKLL